MSDYLFGLVLVRATMPFFKWRWHGAFVPMKVMESTKGHAMSKMTANQDPEWDKKEETKKERCGA
jgi:hypothetical protein